MIVFIVLGFLYGSDYFSFYKKYGTNESSVPVGIYIISLKWWNIKFNWYTRLDKWYIDISAVFPVCKGSMEYIIIFSSADIKICTLNIDRKCNEIKWRIKHDYSRNGAF